VLNDLMRRHARAVILGVLIICGGTVSTYVFNYMTTYAITTLRLSSTIGTILTMTGSLAGIAGIAVGVWVDRFGRKLMLVWSRVIFLMILYPSYVMLTSPQAAPVVVVAINMLINFVFSIGLGAIYAFLPEAFPKSVRSSGLAILYALGVTIFGGTTQFVVAWLIDWTKDPMVPGWYQMIATVVGIIGVVLLMPHAEVIRERTAHVAA
jgi:MFS family permease